MRPVIVNILLAVFLSVCGTAPIWAHDAGVPFSLAQQRRESIKNLAYHLQFRLPESQRQPVEGWVAAKFDLDGPCEIVFDFKAPDQALKSVRVNGRPVSYDFRNEHIVIPASNFGNGRQMVEMDFTAGDQSLNRRADLMYTLLVPDRARTLFPCFDQPNLKAVYDLTLTLPQQWQAVSNSPVTSQEARGKDKVIHFAPTEPLSSYLFSFVAGNLERKEFKSPEGRTISCYYRETDPKKVAQLDEIARQVFAALDWQEAYTGIAYPFAKYDLVILPGFQFGGMEHTGATLYNDTRMFLGDEPTPQQLLTRAQLIAHETSHMWFGDYVTMDWFDDVWTKEVFANYFAARISEPLFPQFSSRLASMRQCVSQSLDQDRTQGSTAIRQQLDNLKDAGLVYNNIIYCKSPLVMEKIVELMGPDAFRDGIRCYLRNHAFGNATWDDLITTLDSIDTRHDLRAFSRSWVSSRGLPQISLSSQGQTLVAEQHDPLGRGLTWPQSFQVEARGAGSKELVTVSFGDGDSIFTAKLPFEPEYVIPNADGRAYAAISLPKMWLDSLVAVWFDLPTPVGRVASLMTLNENYMAGRLPHSTWLSTLAKGLRKETDAIAANAITGYMALPMLTPDGRAVEEELWTLSQRHPMPSVRAELLRLLTRTAFNPTTVGNLLDLWQKQNDPLLNENDYTSLAYELSLRLPGQRQEILDTQRSRITHPDRLAQFDFIASSTTADILEADSAFRSLLQTQNRRVEPWAQAALRYLTHPVRGARPARYIAPALDALPEIQATGDIFMPAGWCSALLSLQLTPEAKFATEQWLRRNPEMPQLLRNKVLQSLPPFTVSSLTELTVM